jgi:hypothetical protein
MLLQNFMGEVRVSNSVFSTSFICVIFQCLAMEENNKLKPLKIKLYFQQ